MRYQIALRVCGKIICCCIGNNYDPRHTLLAMSAPRHLAAQEIEGCISLAFEYTPLQRECGIFSCIICLFLSAGSFICTHVFFLCQGSYVRGIVPAVWSKRERPLKSTRWGATSHVEIVSLRVITILSTLVVAPHRRRWWFYQIMGKSRYAALFFAAAHTRAQSSQIH